jgi:TrpR family trp operon transcriptional repressor
MRTPTERGPEDDEAFAELASILASIDDGELMAEFLSEILTPAEVTEIARRWRLVKLLHEGHPQREIAARLHHSLFKITRGSKELKRPGSAFKRMLEMRSKQ